MMRDKINAFLALGSNEGDRLANIDAAESAVASASGIYLDRSSPTYESPAAEPCEGQPDFLNRVLAIEIWLTPRELLTTCLDIENKLGRDRGKEGDPHVIDVDILLFGDLILDEADLKIPHEALARRPFFLKPLADLTGDIILPGYGVSINSLLAGLAPYELTLFEKKY
ncbi:MAG: 2-amino-4-hydroxy-6-hydroxymethyldihydropteridine diphosphokinase [Candidatus Zixiibacteriota bacterium]|jgi:2-amino-4-hydroxy-6-hydroxymethyldihydropteridine diphosphokinase